MAAEHSCGRCGSGLVYAQGWRLRGSDSWEVLLRCPDCEWHGQATWTRAELDEMDREFTLGFEQIETVLAQLEAQNMTEWVDRFILAVERDLIGADDFQLPRHPRQRG